MLDVLALYRNRGLCALHGFVVMPDHLHLVLTPSDSANISRIMHNVKVAASKRLRAWMHLPPPNWQRSFHDHIVRSGEAYIEIMNYVHENPVRRGLAATPGDYRWLSWANYHRPEEAKIDIDLMVP